MQTGKKVTIVGAGQTGGVIAQLILQRGLAEVALVDILPGLAKGKALDLEQAAAVRGKDIPRVNATSTEDLLITANSNIIVMTTGSPRKPGQSRAELAAATAKVVREFAPPLMQLSPQAIYLGFTNPMDAMTQLAAEVANIPHERVVGQGGLLDSARFRALIAEATGASVADVQAYVLGGHGETTMVPIVSGARVAGAPLSELISAAAIVRIIERTKNGGAEIVSFLQTGSAFFAPAEATVAMVESVLLDQHRILPCCVASRGVYGINTSTFVGLIAELGRNGVEKVYAMTVSDEEREAICRAASITQKLVDLCGKIKRG